MSEWVRLTTFGAGAEPIDVRASAIVVVVEDAGTARVYVDGAPVALRVRETAEEVRALLGIKE